VECGWVGWGWRGEGYRIEYFRIAYASNIGKLSYKFFYVSVINNV